MKTTIMIRVKIRNPGIRIGWQLFKPIQIFAVAVVVELFFRFLFRTESKNLKTKFWNAYLHTRLTFFATNCDKINTQTIDGLSCMRPFVYFMLLQLYSDTIWKVCLLLNAQKVIQYHTRQPHNITILPIESMASEWNTIFICCVDLDVSWFQY